MPAPPAFYYTGGTVPRDAPSYVVRKADEDLLRALRRGELCYVLTSRQMGKSSLMVRAAARLRDEGTTCAVLDLTAIGQNVNAEQWHDGLLNLLARQLNLEDELERFWLRSKRLGPMQQWMQAVQEIVLNHCSGNVVIFIDEIDAVRSLPFSADEFLAGIRECYNRRTETSGFSRLTFCLLGVATPTDLIRDTRMTPFNIGRRIALTDFTADEAAPLAAGLLGSSAPSGSDAGDFARGILRRVVYWTGGHPYLTQRICQAIVEGTDLVSRRRVDAVCAQLFLSASARDHDDNLLFVRERLLRSEVDIAPLLSLYEQVWRGRAAPANEADPLVNVLLLSGVTREQAGRLHVRNPIYRSVFDLKWVRAHFPHAEARRQRAAYNRGLLRATAVYGVMMAVMLVLTWYALHQKHISDVITGRAQRAELSARTEAEALRRNSYFATMNMIQREWEEGRHVDFRTLLQETENYEHRGFEWGYWWNASHGERFAFHPLRVGSATVSPNGMSTVTSEGVGVAKVWDLQTGRQRLTLSLPGAVFVCFAFSPDGKRIVAGEDCPRVSIWDTRNGQLLRVLRPRVNLSAETFAVAISADQNSVAALFGNQTASVWDTRTAKERLHIAVMERRQQSSLGSIALAADGSKLVTPGTVARVWDTRTGKQIVALLGHRPAPYPQFTIWSVACSGDGRRIVTAGSDGEARVWDVQSGGKPMTLSPGDAGICSSVALSADGRRIVTGHSSGNVRVWDARTGRELRKLLAHALPVKFVAVSADGTRIVSAAHGDLQTGGEVKVWDWEGDSRFTLLQPNAGKAAGIAFSPSPGNLVATAHYDHTARIWDARTGRQVRVLRGHTSALHFVAFSPNGERVVTASDDRTARVWEVRTGRERLRLEGHSAAVYCAAYSPDGTRIATASFDHTARVWDSLTGRELLRINGEPDAEVYWLAWSPDGVHLATSGGHHSARLWDARTGRETLRLGTGQGCYGLPAFSSDGARVITGYSPVVPGTLGNVAVWDAHTGQRLLRLHGNSMNPSYFAFSPDQRRIATGGNDNIANLWDAATGQELLTLHGHTDFVQGLAFSPDGLTLATCSWDGTARLWRAASYSPSSTRVPDLPPLTP